MRGIGRRVWCGTVAEAAELLLAGGVPHVEDERAAVGVEQQRVHLHTDRRDVLLLKLTLQIRTACAISDNSRCATC